MVDRRKFSATGTKWNQTKWTDAFSIFNDSKLFTAWRWQWRVIRVDLPLTGRGTIIQTPHTLPFPSFNPLLLIIISSQNMAAIMKQKEKKKRKRERCSRHIFAQSGKNGDWGRRAGEREGVIPWDCYHHRLEFLTTPFLPAAAFPGQEEKNSR